MLLSCVGCMSGCACIVRMWDPDEAVKPQQLAEDAEMTADHSERSGGGR